MNRFLCAIAFASAFALPAFAQDAAAPALGAGTDTAPVSGVTAYQFDPGHSQAVFSYDHMGFSTSHGTVNGIEGAITLDADDPAQSTVEARFPVMAIVTTTPELDTHLQSDDFFGGADGEVIFTSTAVEPSGDDAATLTGDLTMNGVTKPVVLEVTLNQRGMNQVEQKQAVGFTATTTILRSEFNLGMFAPAVSDEVAISLNIEAFQD